MRNLLYVFLLVGSSLLLGSCSNDSDTTPPTIEIQKPVENEVVFTGSILKMKFRFTDEYGTQKYMYEIFPKDFNGSIGEFTYENVVFIPKVYTELVLDHSVKIPETASGATTPTVTGDYILRVTATDFYGNVNVVDRIFKIDSVSETED